MSEELIIQFCSPTMAGLKVANLFSYRHTDVLQVIQSVAFYNKMLNEKGLYFKLFNYKSDIALIYVYRLNKLRTILSNPNIQNFLKKQGYQKLSTNDCLETLQQHLLQGEFPHEIGIFLGYPLPDVKAFIKNKGQGHKSIGHWKVYFNEKEANSLFRKFDKCTRVYDQTYKQGVGIKKLTIVG